MKERFFKKGMISRHPFGAKIIAFALVAMLVTTMLPASMFVANAATTDKVADNSTINEWQDYFLDLDEKGTEYAGGVWTDKSVFESGSDFDAALSDNEAKTGISTDEDNFLVAMSALATNKEVVGYSTTPTDTIFVLDVSQSMDNAQSVPDMVSAANDAIDALLKLNKNNRVGLVLYSGNKNTGNSTAGEGILLLDLNRYSPNSNGQYIRYTGNSASNTSVTIASSLKYEDGGYVRSSSKETVGGTYIQTGLYVAMNEFLAADPVVEEDNVQGGETRMPIFVLMSDGAPTAGTTSYTGNGTNVGTSNMGDGTASSNQIGFVTQLTAAYAKKMAEAHYETDAKFYTLGLNLQDGGETERAVAGSVMNPGLSTNAINQFWDRLFTYGSVNVSGRVVVTRAENLLEREDQLYVDRYFDADSNEKLEDAFGDIVAEIILQSAYYPTYIENGDRDLSGYVSFTDEIGHFMEVKEIKGILLGEKLFTGETLAKMMGEGEFGNASTFTENGWELVETVAKRIGVDQSTAITLLQNAWRDGQLYYNSDTDYSNYIGWYEKGNGEYVGLWSQNDGVSAEQTAVANGAKYITKSYGYYGSEDAGITGSDMMHVVIKVRTDIETGLQTVIFEVPASLMPLITYEITLDTDSYETAEDITMAVTEQTPIRLLFEVGLTDEINEYNLAEIMSAEGVHSHPVKDAYGNETGEYYFYTNVWGYGKDYTELQPSDHEVAESVFKPSTVNERYYYTEDTVILVKNADNKYTPYTGESVPTGDGYYRAYRIFQATGDGNAAEMTYVYEPIGADTLSYNDGSNVAKDEASGEWYVKEGAARTVLPSYHIEKIGNPANPTETLRYSRYAVINESEIDEDYDVYSFQGNNGRLKMAPATGIKLTKQVDSTITDADIEYTFEVKVAGADGEYKTYDGSTESTITFTDGKATVKLKAGESVIISGLPTAAYEITEVIAETDKYKVASVTVDGEAEDDVVAKDTITANAVDSVVFTNTEAKEGDLIVRKNVTNSYTDAAAAVNEKEFTINVKLTDADGMALAEGTKFKTIQGTTEKEVILDAYGSFNVTLKHNESITIKDIPDGTKYVVTETNLPTGFRLNTAAADLTGTIVTNETDIVTVVNDYRPDGVPAAISVKLTKSIAGRDWVGTDVFEFQLEKMNADGTWTAVGSTQTVKADGKTAVFEIPEYSLTTVGTHYFRVLEVNADEIPGITNDTAKYFAVVVTEKNGDGKLEVESITPYEGVTVDNNSVAIDFVNTYTTGGEAVVNIPVEKHMKNDTNVDVSLDGYVFELYAANAATGDNLVAKVTTNAAGEAMFHLKYTATQFEELDTDNDNKVTLTYTLSEKNDGITNVNYDASVYDVTVVLTSDNGKLQASMTMKKADTAINTAVFTNTFDIPSNAEAKFTLNATKELQDKNLTEDMFTFNLYPTGADFVVANNTAAIADGTNDANGNVTFDTISYDIAGTYYYVAKEAVPAETNGITYDATEYYVTVTVTYDTTENKLVASTSIVKPGEGVVEDVKFVNDYNVQPTTLQLAGTKKMTGKDLASGEFTFVLRDSEGNEVAIATNEHAIADANGVAAGAFVFPEIEYAEAGQYEYTVAEKNDSKTGYTYDDTVYSVVVNVTDNGDGTLTAEPIVKIGENDAEDGIIFKNSYEPEPVTVNFTATKALENRKLTENEFHFNVYAADADFNEGTVVATGSNEEDGDIAFDSNTATVEIDPIVITEAGTYYYVIKENIPGADEASFDPDVVYDPIEYHVTVIAWDMGGKLNTRITYTANGVPVDSLYFSNVYFEPAPTSLTLDVRKELTGRDIENGEFTFELYETDEKFNIDIDSKPIETVANGELSNGTVLFRSLVYDVTDLGDADSEDFYYVIKEKAGEAGGVTYDETVYKVVVTVSNNGDGELEAVVKEINNKAVTSEEDSIITFKNTYTAEEATLDLSGTKKLENKNLNDGDFTFALYETDETYRIDEKNPIDTATNKDGTFAFDQLKFDEAGTHYYVVAEIAGDDAGTEDGEVAYDTAKYQIKVVVTDNGNGEFELDVTYDTDSVLTDKTEAKITDLNFVNGYNPLDAKINLAGTKVLEGRELAKGEFTFELYETASDYKVAADAKPIQTKVNDEDGSFVFDTIVYDTLATDTEATHYYVVKEYAPADENGIKYDEREYKIKAVVSNDGNGNLAQKVTVEGEEFNFESTAETVEFEALNFTNKYESDLPDGAGLGIKGQKNITGDRTTVAAGEFTFTLAEVAVLNGQEIVTELDQTTAGVSGAFNFDVIDTYEEPGTYKYRVTENAGTVEGMTYDATVYDVTVEVVDDGNGNLVIKEPVITVGGNIVKDIEFNNVYDDPTPDTPVQTGDSFSTSLYLLLMLMALTGMTAATVRRRTN